jgi:PAS domain S-box-containing protein
MNHQKSDTEAAVPRPPRRLQAQTLTTGGPDEVKVEGSGDADPDRDAEDLLDAAREELRAHWAHVDALLARRVDPAAWRHRLFDALPVPAVLTDPTGLVLHVNAAALALIGRRLDEVVMNPVTELLHPADRHVFHQVLSTLGPGRRHRVEVRVDAYGRAGQPVPVGVDAIARLDTAADVPTRPSRAPDDPVTASATVTWILNPRAADDGGDELGGPLRGFRVAEALAELSHLPLDDDDPRLVLARAALLVERALPSSDGVSISFGSPADPESQATDNAFAQAVDGIQHHVGQGPCLDAYDTGRVVVCDDLPADPRWPNLARAAAPAGLRTVLAVPIRTPPRTVGVLNLYASRPLAFDAYDRDAAGLLVHGVRAVVQETRDRQELRTVSEQLREALGSRAVIDQAKGILMARSGVDADEAFAQLVAVSRRSNVKLQEVARLLLDDATHPLTTADEA